MNRTLLSVIAVLGILVLWGIFTYNRLIASSQAVERQWAQVQNVYQRRADLIPNLVATVSGAANFEKSTLTEVTEARASVGKIQVNANDALNDPSKFREFERAQSELSSALSRLLVVVERYPELRATANFASLQAQLEGTENRIAVERGRFNEAAQEYNVRIKKFPTMILANLFGFRERPYFAAEPEAQRPPKVEFDFSSPKTDQAPAPAH